MSSEQMQSMHLNLARVFEQRGDAALRQAQHLMCGGAKSRAVDTLVHHSIESRKLTSTNAHAFRRMIADLPHDWYRTYSDVLRACDELDRRKRDAFEIRARLAGIVSIKGWNDAVHVPFWLHQLEAASGLVDFTSSDPALEPRARLQLALEAASSRYRATPEHERVVDPQEAMPFLAQAMSFMIPVAAPALDLPTLRKLPSVAPLAELAPALRVVESLRIGVIARVSGRLHLALRIYRELLDHLAKPDHGGLQQTHAKYSLLQVSYATALIEAMMGLSDSLERAEQMAADPLLRVNAAVLLMVHALWQGDNQGGDAHRRNIEELRVRTGATATDQTHLLFQVAAYAAMEDLTRLKQMLVELAPLAEKYAGWAVVQVYATAECQRLRGDLESACASLAECLGWLRAGDHQLWALLAAAHIRVLSAGGDHAQAVLCGRGYLESARASELGWSAEHFIIAPLAIAQAKLGQTEAATEIAVAVRQALELGATGIPLGLLYEAQAYVALYLDHTNDYLELAQLCARELLRHNNRALAARVQRLKREAQLRASGSAGRLPPASGGLAEIKTRLSQCLHASDRAALMLQLLAERSGATQGFLFQVAHTGIVCAATVGEPAYDAELHALVRRVIEAETHPQDEETTVGAGSLLPVDERAANFPTYRRIVLNHRNDSGWWVTGVAVLRTEADQVFTFPGDIVGQLSQLAQESGDVAGILVEILPP